ncbi:MAG: hypothetical protein KKB79_02760 [Nanoarchaeota archaeon]|nr:hypothetical protein [Nanoarchaeota archaeon]
MGVLEQVSDLKNQGLEESAIVNQLTDSGISPKDIIEAINHVKIKKAVSSEDTGNSSKGMEPSIMANPKDSEEESLPTEGEISDEDLTPPKREDSLGTYQISTPMTKEMSEEEDKEVPKPSGKKHSEEEQEEYSPGQNSKQEYFPSQNQDYSQGFQQDYDYSAQPQAMAPQGLSDADTIIEIAEQVFIEKIKNIQKKVDDLTEFKTLSEVKIDNISDRLRRIENTIDRLQADVLEKVGSYGRGIESVKREMDMVQESFGKVVNNLADHGERTHHHTTQSHKTHPIHKTHSTSHAKKKVKKTKKR